VNRWKRSAAATLVLLAVTAAPAWAATAEAPLHPILISAPVAAPTAVRADLPLPSAIAMNGVSVTFDQAPMVSEGVLMVPLRAVAEAAGGKVTWDGSTRTVTVRVGDRTAYFVIGADAAEMNQDNVRYIQRNMIKMARASEIVGGRTLVSADSLSNILGIMAESSGSGLLRLVAPPAPATPAEDWVMTGTIENFAGTDRGLRILVKGAPMSNGEASLTWFAITDQTEITVQANGTERSGTTTDLQVGKHVTVRPTGPLLESYPAQGGAASVTVSD
jgi:hypothetical protein